MAQATWPTFLVWLCTSRCNLRCIHCYTWGRFRGPELSTEEALKMVEEAAELGVVHLAITGGEPFLREDVFEVARSAVEHGLRISFTTNATLLNEDIVRELRELEAFVFISLDGADREVCDSIRGEGTWRRALRSLAELRSYGVEYSTIMTVNSLNYKQARKFVLLNEAVGSWEAIFLPLIPVGRAGERRSLLPTPDQLAECLREAEEAVEEVGYRAGIWCAPFASRLIRSKRLYVYACPDRTLDVAPNGDVLLCDTLDLRVGNVKEGVQRAWEEYVAFREDYLAGREVGNMDPCSTCPQKDFCQGGCLARAYLLAGDILKPDPLCPLVAKA